MSQDLLNKIKSQIFSLKGNRGKNAKIAIAFSEIDTYETHADLCGRMAREYPNTKILSLNYFLSRHLEEKRIEHDCVYSGSMGEKYADLNEQAELLSQNWFKDKDTRQDFTLFDGLPLGYCLELPALFFFQIVLKSATDIESYFKRKVPEIIIFFDSGRDIKQCIEVAIDFNVFQGLLPLLCGEMGVGLVEVKTPLVPPEQKAGDLLSGLAFAPPVTVFGRSLRVPKFLYPILKCFFLTIKNILAKKKFLPGRPNIFIASATTFNYLGAKLVDRIIESKKFNLFVWDGESREPEVANIVRCVPLERMERASLCSKFRQQFEADREKVKRATEYKGFSIFELYPFFFEKIYTTWFPDLVIHAKRVSEQLKKKKIKAIISHSDQSVFERMTVLVGNHLAIPTIVIQHGLEEPVADTRLGFPSIAGHHFVWGKVNKEFRIAKGVEAHRIDVVGCPLHEFVSHDQGDGRLSLDVPGTFLFISNSGGQGRVDNRMSFVDNEVQIKLMLETMKSFPRKTLVIKPRFHDLQMGVYQKLIRDAGVTNAVVAHEPIVSLLNKCDLFFCVFSTAALEGMILDKPGIQFLFVFNGKKALMEKTGTIPMPFTRYGALLGVEQADANILKQCIESIYHSGETRRGLNEGRIKFLRDYANLEAGEPTENFIRALEKCV